MKMGGELTRDFTDISGYAEGLGKTLRAIERGFVLASRALIYIHIRKKYKREKHIIYIFAYQQR